MNDDDLKKRLERLGNHSPENDSSSPSNMDKLAIEKLTQVLTETRSNVREHQRTNQKEISDLQAKVELQKRKTADIEHAIRIQNKKMDSLQKENQQLRDQIQSTSRKWRIWPFGGPKS